MNKNWVPKILLLLSVITFFLIVLGGTVRNMAAGLSCPDWPLCYGKVIPPMDSQIFVEWFHRKIAATVGLLLLFAAFLSYRKPELKEKIGKTMVLTIGVLFVQVILGGLTVLKLLNHHIVSLHLITGTIFFLLLFSMTLKTHESKPLLFTDLWNDSRSKKLQKFVLWLVNLSLFIVLVQIYLGGRVSSNYAGLACSDFPTCQGSFVPTFEGLPGIQWIHRLGALVVMVVVSFMVGVCFSVVKIRNHLKPWLIAVVLLLATQIGLGISNVIYQLPLKVAVAHLGVAVLLCATIWKVRHEINRLVH